MRISVLNDLIEHYKNHLTHAEITFDGICAGDPPVFELPTETIELTPQEVKEFIKRYCEEIAPLVKDLKRIT